MYNNASRTDFYSESRVSTGEQCTCGRGKRRVKITRTLYIIYTRAYYYYYYHARRAVSRAVRQDGGKIIIIIIKIDCKSRSRVVCPCVRRKRGRARSDAQLWLYAIARRAGPALSAGDNQTALADGRTDGKHGLCFFRRLCMRIILRYLTK